MRPLVISHANCTDGLTAAWVACGALHDAEHYPANYGTEPPDVAHRQVFIVDFSYKRPVMERLAADAATLVVLDHHKTAQADLDGFPQWAGLAGYEVRVVFDMEHSGARLAWDWFYPNAAHTAQFMGTTERPWLIDYVEDRDLWRWALPNSRLVSAAIEAEERSFESWDRLAKRSISFMVSRGETIELYRRRCIESAVALARVFTIGGYAVKCSNISEMRFGSDSAHELSKGAPFGAYYFVRADGIVQFGLRSTEDCIDVSEIAKFYGGGGHKHAAGFQVDGAAFAAMLRESRSLG